MASGTPANTSPECDFDYVPDAGRELGIEHALWNCIAFGSRNSALLFGRS